MLPNIPPRLVPPKELNVRIEPEAVSIVVFAPKVILPLSVLLAPLALIRPPLTTTASLRVAFANSITAPEFTVVPLA